MGISLVYTHKTCAQGGSGYKTEQTVDTMEGCVNIITRLVLTAVSDIIAATETSYGGTEMLRMINTQRDFATANAQSKTAIKLRICFNVYWHYPTD